MIPKLGKMPVAYKPCRRARVDIPAHCEPRALLRANQNSINVSGLVAGVILLPQTCGEIARASIRFFSFSSSRARRSPALRWQVGIQASALRKASWTGVSRHASGRSSLDVASSCDSRIKNGAYNVTSMPTALRRYIYHPGHRNLLGRIHSLSHLQHIAGWNHSRQHVVKTSSFGCFCLAHSVSEQQQFLGPRWCIPFLSVYPDCREHHSEIHSLWSSPDISPGAGPNWYLPGCSGWL